MSYTIHHPRQPSGLITISNEHLKKAILVRYANEPQMIIKYHTSLSEYFERISIDATSQLTLLSIPTGLYQLLTSSIYISQRRLQEYPYHLLHADKNNDLSRYITNELHFFALLEHRKADLYRYYSHCISAFKLPTPQQGHSLSINPAVMLLNGFVTSSDISRVRTVANFLREVGVHSDSRYSLC